MEGMVWPAFELHDEQLQLASSVSQFFIMHEASLLGIYNRQLSLSAFCNDYVCAASYSILAWASE